MDLMGCIAPFFRMENSVRAQTLGYLHQSMVAFTFMVLATITLVRLLIREDDFWSRTRWFAVTVLFAELLFN